MPDVVYKRVLEARVFGWITGFAFVDLTRLPSVRGSTVLALLVSAVACGPTYLSVATLRQTAPSCGAHPVAPRSGDNGPTYFACQVDQPAQSPADRPVTYPKLLAGANVEGSVQLQFVVDEHGSIDSTTVTVLASGHDVFTQAARESLLAWQTRPAWRGGKPVRQLATQAFCFRVGDAGARTRCALELPLYPAATIAVACAEPTATICTSHGGCRQSSSRPAPNLRCK